VHLAQHNRAQFAQRQAAEAQMNAAQTQHDEAAAQLAELQGERARLGRFWHYFKRRALEKRVHAAQARLDEAHGALGSAQAALADLAHQAAPEFPGLSIGARRSINLAAIAYAEVLCLRVAPLKTALLELAREATSRREAADSYGTPKECVLLMGEITRAQKLIEERAGLAEEIRVRGERLQRVARYRAPNDGSPLTDSIALSEGDIMELAPMGAHARRLPNVLAEDTWDLFRVLMR
jgi:hypothetical protein